MTGFRFPQPRWVARNDTFQAAVEFEGKTYVMGGPELRLADAEAAARVIVAELVRDARHTILRAFSGREIVE